MELEVGLKVTRTRAHDDTTSVSELRISKSTAGPVFVSTETHAMFILTCYLKGYNRNSFEIEISEDGREISISGEKPVQEMMVMGRVMLKKKVEIVRFRKIFKIPNGVVLDRIKAKFDEDESLLKIVMPKLVKGICGVQIEEVKKEEGFGESSQKASEIGKNECVSQEEEGLSDKKLVQSPIGDVTADTIQKEIESPRFEAMKKSETGENADHIPNNIGETSQEVLKEPAIQPLEESENDVLARPPRITGEDKFEGTPKTEFGEFKFENEAKDEEGMETEVSKEGFEVIEAAKEGGEFEKELAEKIGVGGKEEVERTKEGEIRKPKFEAQERDEQRVKEIHEATQKKEVEVSKFESEGKDEEREGTEISKGGLEAIDTRTEGREFEKLLAGAVGVDTKAIVDETKQKETKEAKFETDGKDEERVGREITTKELEAIESTMEEVESKKLHGEKVEISSEGIVEGTEQKELEDKGRVEDVFGGTQKKDIVKLEFETGGRDEERVGTKISKRGLEAIETPLEGGESEKMPTGAIGVNEEEIVDGTKKREIEEAKFETEGKEERRVGKEITEEELEATKEIRDGDKERVEDELGGTRQKEIGKPEFETGGRDEEKLGTEISKEGLEAIETPTGGKSEMVLAGSIGVSGEEMVEETKLKGSEAAKFEIEGKDEEKVGTENSKKGLEAVESKMEGEESEKLLARKIGVSGEDIVEGTQQREIVKPKYETEDRDEKKVGDVFKGTPRKDIGKHECAIEGKDEERVGTEISKEGFGVTATTIEGGKSEKLLSSAIGVSEEDRVEGTKKGEIEVPKFETEKDKEIMKQEISDEGFEARKSTIKEFAEQEPKLPVQLEESKDTFEGMEGGEDRSGGTRQKEIEEPKFLCGKEENGKVPKSADSKVAILEGIEEPKAAKSGSQEAEGFLEKVEGEESNMLKEASKVVEKDNARESQKMGVEESDVRSSRDGQHVQKTIVREVLEVLETDTTEFPKQMLETKAQREREVKVKIEVVINTRDAAKEGFEKPKTGDTIQLGTGQPSIGFKDSDERGFDEKETLEVAKWEKTKALKEGCVEGSVETEPYVEKVKGESNDKVQSEAFRDFMEDKKRERTQKETKEPKIGTKHKDQQCLQDMPMKTAESLDKRGGPKDTKIEDMKEAKRKSEETKVVSDDESTAKEKIQETEIERMCKTKQFRKALQEVPEAKDPKTSGNGRHERESMLSTQQLEAKVTNKICEECKRLEAGLEREKCRTTLSFKDEKLRREKEVVEPKPKIHEKEHPRKSEEVEKEVKPLEARGAFPEVKKEVETKNEVDEAGQKESPPPKVKMESLEPLESEKESMKWRFPKTKKHVPEAREEEKEEYEVAKPPEVVKSSRSTEQSMVDKQKSEIDFPESYTSRTPLEGKEIEALQPNVLADQNSGEKQYLKTLTEDRGHYMLENEKTLEIKKVAEEEKLKQKYGEETMSCKRERTMIVECEEDKKLKIQKNTLEFEDGSEKINQVKGVVEEFKEVVADNETEKSQKEIPSPQTTEIQSKEEISEIREVQQEKRRKVPFHANGESEAVTSKREVESPKPTAVHPKESSMEFSYDKQKGEADELLRKEPPTPCIEKLSKEPSEIARPCVKEDSPKVDNFQRFQKAKEPTYSLEGTEASEPITNELDKAPAKNLELAEEGKIDERCEGGHPEFQELEKQESEIDFQESTKRISDQEVEKTQFLQQEENHERHAIEEEKAGEQEHEVQMEISQESADLEDIEVEASEKKMEVCAPMFIVGSVFIASLIIFFTGHKRAGKR